MIDRLEILEMSRELSLAPQVVEKDYALGWLLAGIYSCTGQYHVLCLSLLGGNRLCLL